MTQDKMDERFVTAFERIATALETIAWKQAVTLVAGTVPIPAAGTTVPPYMPVYQSPNTVGSPNGVTFSKNEAVSQPDGFAVSFNDMVESGMLRVGTGG